MSVRRYPRMMYMCMDMAAMPMSMMRCAQFASMLSDTTPAA